MCTVTFIPGADKIYLTSNRDEKSWRKQALPPRFYFHNDIELIYPRDEDAGGTWIAANKNGNAAVLLNGAFAKHVPAPTYRKSRGLVFLDVIKSCHSLQYFLHLDLLDIEPFTLILFEENELYECRWDGTMKFTHELKSSMPYIWSSVTLYNNEVAEKREAWFADFLSNNNSPTQNDILRFHRFAGDGNTGTDLLMNRSDLVYTVSITSLEISSNAATMKYFDFKKEQSYVAKTSFANAAFEYAYHA